MDFIMADADKELTLSTFITINHRQTIQSVKVQRWEDGTQTEKERESERSGKRDQKREREGQTE